MGISCIILRPVNYFQNVSLVLGLHSTVGAVQSLLSDFYEGHEAQNAVIFRSYDMSKAFNTVGSS